MKILSLITAGLILLSLAAFRNKEKPSGFTAGVYGVCDCDPTQSSMPLIALTIREDNTFRYIDNADPAKKLDITGTWSMKKDKIVLNGFDATSKIHDTWTFQDNCIRSRNKMNFRRLCLVKSC